MSVYDDPNREAVGLEPAWVEGEGGGGSEAQPAAAPAQAGAGSDLDAMTKDELLAYAQQLGVSPANASMTKEEIRQGIDEHQAG